MPNHFDKAVEESAEKSAFVCSNCGHRNIPAATGTAKQPGAPIRDQFSEASTEAAEKSAFVCVSCGHAQK